MNFEKLMTQQVLNQMGKQLGFSNGIPSQYIDMANTLLMSGMARNVKSKDGASSLYNALNKDHAAESDGLLGNLVNMIPNILGGGSRNTNGAGILNNIFGTQLDPIITAFSNATGLPKDKAKRLLMILAPIALAYFANKMKQNKMNQQELAREVEQEYRQPKRNIRTKDDKGMLEQLLDRNGDGNFMDEAAGLFRQLILK